MRIALLGTRGIPAAYGGYETFAEELCSRLAQRGHRVTVYCRQRHSEPTYRGVHLVSLPTIRNKYLDTLAHSALSTLHLLTQRHDAVLYCNAANAVFTLLPRLMAMPTALNVDGIERLRKKWNGPARAWYRLSEFLATRFPTVMVTDARQIAAYYREQYRKDSVCIPYGAPLTRLESTETLQRIGVEPCNYWLYVTRFEPENNPLLVRECFEQVKTERHLVLVGDAPYAAAYIAAIRNTRDTRIHLPGAIYGAGYHELQSHSFGYIHATEVGGTHPALIEAMGKGNLVLYLNTPENAEVAGDAGIPFEKNGLQQAIEKASALSPEDVERYRHAARERVRRLYSWEAITDLYENLFFKLHQGEDPLSVQWNPV
jgi:glycosyltransferase involved in cell wall biosynthesis